MERQTPIPSCQFNKESTFYWILGMLGRQRQWGKGKPAASQPMCPPPLVNRYVMNKSIKNVKMQWSNLYLVKGFFKMNWFCKWHQRPHISVIFRCGSRETYYALKNEIIVCLPYNMGVPHGFWGRDLLIQLLALCGGFPPPNAYVQPPHFSIFPM